MERRPQTRIQALAERSFHGAALACAALVLLLMVAILLELVHRSGLTLGKFGWKFLSSAAWNPVTGDFGAASSIYGTVVSTIIALVIAIPLAIVIALFLVEVAHPRISRPVGYAIELLAAIPSIIYGMWGLFVLAPVLSEHVQPFLGKLFGKIPLFTGPPMGIGMLTAGLVLALMVLPFITAVVRDIFALVPAVLKEAGYGMGATTWEVARKVTMRHGMRGMVGGIFLGLGRAIGETMAVTFVIGNDHRIAASLFASGNTISSTLANEFTEASDPAYLSALVELGLILFVITLLIQVGVQLWLKHLKLRLGAEL
ncbi:MAG TPA: phosphate ABC transporter permease subunit PstC [Thermoanaerobaculaceae bacterium]|nr:phosphate ABC transporter permease subunit PstC [Thermoanaerobaculaceae bacterium]